MATGTITEKVGPDNQNNDKCHSCDGWGHHSKYSVNKVPGPEYHNPDPLYHLEGPANDAPVIIEGF